MTDAQIAAFKQVNEILKEHFDSSVVAVIGEVVPHEELTQEQADKASDHEFAYHGGYAASIGLTELLKFKIYNTQMAPDDRDPPP